MELLAFELDQDGLCHLEPHLFLDPRRDDEAVRVCHACPVMQQCREWARTTFVSGVCGGLRETEREHPELTRPREVNELREQVLELTRLGRSARQISEELGIGTRAVVRHRGAGRVLPAPPVLVRRPANTDLLPCGTDGAYSRHRKNGEQPCGECLAAHAREESRRAKARRQQVAA